jgi:hypothetical protein
MAEGKTASSRKPFTVVTSMLVDCNLKAFTQAVTAYDASAAGAIAAELAHLKLPVAYGATVSQAIVFDGHLRPAPAIVENSEEECQACGGTGLLTADSARGLDQRALLDPSHPLHCGICTAPALPWNECHTDDRKD